MQEASSGALPGSSAVPAETPAPPRGPRELRIEFTGSGSEYFRIWIVNLLLSLLTLGLYLPFAKARRIRYFYANTHIDGQALTFHGDPWRMFRGFMLLAALMIVYGASGRLSPLAGVIAFGLLCLVWPALWRASLQFRLANTSWRGLRFGFRGDLAGAYRSVLPLYLPSILIVFGQFFWAATGEGDAGAAAQAGLAQGIVGLLGIALMLGLFPWGLALVKRYQHQGYTYASQQTALDVKTARFYSLAFKSFWWQFLPLVLLGVLLAVAIPALKAGGAGPAAAIAVSGGLLLAYLVFFALGLPYFSARLQNLVWSGTRSAALQFDSRLRYRALAWLSLKNWLLTVLTLGLYRPFAAVNTARLRLAAISIGIDGDLDAWSAEPGLAQRDATGEAAGDFFGIDMGL